MSSQPFQQSTCMYVHVGPPLCVAWCRCFHPSPRGHLPANRVPAYKICTTTRSPHHINILPSQIATPSRATSTMPRKGSDGTRLSQGMTRQNRKTLEATFEIPVDPSTSGEGHTAYLSKNNQEGLTFQAISSENSPLAARLMKIALQNQPEHRKESSKRRGRLEGHSQRLLTVQGEPVPQSMSVTSPSYLHPNQKSPAVSSPHPPRRTLSPQQPPYNSLSYSQTYDPLRDGNGQQPLYHSTVQDTAFPQQGRQYSQVTDSSYLTRVNSPPPPPPPEYYRYEHDGQIEYYKKAPGGELRISAPLESQEARVLDHAAAELTVRPQYPGGQVSSLDFLHFSSLSRFVDSEVD